MPHYMPVTCVQTAEMWDEFQFAPFYPQQLLKTVVLHAFCTKLSHWNLRFLV